MRVTYLSVDLVSTTFTSGHPASIFSARVVAMSRVMFFS